MRSMTTFYATCSIVLAAVGGALAFATLSSAAEVEPYEARITVARAQVRSGPGEKFYPTQTLAEGETVEVYREHATGWVAIRPPQESFSWVFARHVRIREDGFGVVNKDDVASRIGSRFGGQRNAVQVKLRKDEVVEILGEEQVGGETWYKIAPPAGEFRWVHAGQVRRAGPPEMSEPDPKAEPIVVHTSASEQGGVEAENIVGSDQEVTAPPLAKGDEAEAEDWRAVGRSAESGSSPDAIDATSQSPQQTATTGATSSATSNDNAADITPIGAGNGENDSLSRELAEIELRLSRMVAAPVGQWNTTGLERDAEALLARAQSPAEREAVKATLAKLDQFNAIGQRYQQVAVGGAVTGQQAITPIPAMAGAATGGEGRYDAVGVLRPVVSKRPGAPQFALVNDQGQVISFVTPTPDMNLQPYLGHRVGVVGTRGFIPEFQRAHVTAGRVTPLVR